MRKRSALLTAFTLLGFATPASSQTVGEVFRKVNPTVVVVRAKGRDLTAGGEVRFGEIGSGALVSADGLVMTAAHVVQTMDEVSVEFIGGETVKAQIVASEPAADLALLRLERVPSGSAVASLGNSDAVRVGDQVIVIGAPYGLTHSMTVGWISARWAANTVYPAMPLAEFFQTDAVINTGNSGGPLFNMAGEVIGIVSHNISKSGGSEGLGFVVTMNTARKLLLEQRSFWSGLEGRLLSDSLADLLNVPPKETGYLVKAVAAGSPAAALGIRGGTKPATIDGEAIVLGGDVILRVQGLPIRGLADYEAVRRSLTALPTGGVIEVTVLRSGTIIELEGRKP